MNKFDLVHATILVIAILLGYAAMEGILSLLNLAFYLSDILAARRGDPVFPIVFASALYLVAAFVLIRNGRRIAGYILRSDTSKSGSDDGADGIEWHLDRKSIVFVVLIGFGLHTLIVHLPNALTDSFNAFRNQVNSAPFRMPASRDALALDLLHITIGCFLIFGAASLTNYIERIISPRLSSESKTT